MSLDARVQALSEQAIRDQAFPGCQIGLLAEGKITVESYGRLRYDDDSPLVTNETLYDIASVTKSIPTNSIILKLAEEGRLSLDDQTIKYLPELRNDYRNDILIRHLITYTVVFKIPALAEIARTSPGSVLHTIFTAPLVAPPGEKFFYTNAPAILLGLIAEKILGEPLDKIAQKMFFEPLEMRRTTFRPRLDTSVVAPSEASPKGDIIGLPHDESARALRQNGTVAGNAALFSTAGDILLYMHMLLNMGSWDGKKYFDPATVQAMHTNQIQVLGEQVGLGWEMSRALVPDDVGSSNVFGKTGFTGCAVVADPAIGKAFVYLTNRNYPHRPGSREAIKNFRHDLARILLEA